MEAFHLLDATFAGVAFRSDQLDVSTWLQLTASDAANTDNAHEAVVVECRHLHLERAIEFNFRCFNVINNHLEQWRHVVSHVVRIIASNTVQGGSVNHREVELFFGRAEAVEQVEDFVHYPVRTCTRTVNFVDNNDRTQAALEGFLGYEAGLRHRAINRVYQKTH